MKISQMRLYAFEVQTAYFNMLSLTFIKKPMSNDSKNITKEKFRQCFREFTNIPTTFMSNLIRK